MPTPNDVVIYARYNFPGLNLSAPYPLWAIELGEMIEMLELSIGESPLPLPHFGEMWQHYLPRVAQSYRDFMDRHRLWRWVPELETTNLMVEFHPHQHEDDPESPADQSKVLAEVTIWNSEYKVFTRPMQRMN